MRLRELPPSQTTIFHRPRLPLELVHIILRNVDSANEPIPNTLAKPTLAACTLVHSSWLTFARCLLFRSIRLDALTMPQRPHSNTDVRVDVSDFGAFIAFMGTNQLLAKAVRRLEFNGFLSEELDSRAAPPTLAGETFGGADADNDVGMGGEDDSDVYATEKSVREIWTTLEWEILLLIVTRTLPSLRELTLDSVFIDLPCTFDSQYELESFSTHAKAKLDTHIPLERLILRRVGTTSNTNRSFISLIDAFDAAHITIDELPFNDPQLDDTVSLTSPSPASSHALSRPSQPLFRADKRTTSLEVFGYPHCVFFLHVFRCAPFARNLTCLRVHVNHAEDVAALNGLLKTVGRSLKELEIDLRPVSHASKPEVYLDHDTYVALILNFTLFPCLFLQSFTLSFDVSFDYSGSSNALDCTPQILTTLPPSVTSITLNMNFVYVVQAAAIGLNWTGLHGALKGRRRQLKQGVRFVVSNEDTRIPDEERRGVTTLFQERFHMMRDVLKVEFSP